MKTLGQLLTQKILSSPHYTVGGITVTVLDIRDIDMAALYAPFETREARIERQFFDDYEVEEADEVSLAQQDYNKALQALHLAYMRLHSAKQRAK